MGCSGSHDNVDDRTNVSVIASENSSTSPRARHRNSSSATAGVTTAAAAAAANSGAKARNVVGESSTAMSPGSADSFALVVPRNEERIQARLRRSQIRGGNGGGNQSTSQTSRRRERAGSPTPVLSILEAELPSERNAASSSGTSAKLLSFELAVATVRTSTSDDSAGFPSPSHNVGTTAAAAAGGASTKAAVVPEPTPAADAHHPAPTMTEPAVNPLSQPPPPVDAGGSFATSLRSCTDEHVAGLKSPSGAGNAAAVRGGDRGADDNDQMADAAVAAFRLLACTSASLRSVPGTNNAMSKQTLVSSTASCRSQVFTS